ncbi:MAG: hypothetical protein JNL58_29465 [Planctomyces sp.]|nr:hypothetical protein [Planctomyces sp.]
MSDDEVGVTVFSAVAALICWVWWYGSTLSTIPVQVTGRTPSRALLLVTPLLSAALLFMILRLWAAVDVRDDGRYMTMYTLMGLAVSGIATFIPTWLGISFQHDVLQRSNRSAAWVACGWTVGAMLAFSGANIGDGPGWWVVVFSAMLSMGSLLLMFVAWQFLTGSHDAITIDRDLATGLRMASMFVGCGAVLGVSVAGNWVSVEATTSDFCMRAWPALIIFILAIAFHAVLKPTPESPKPPVFIAGVLPSLFLLSMAVVWLLIAGPKVTGVPG